MQFSLEIQVPMQSWKFSWPGLVPGKASQECRSNRFLSLHITTDQRTLPGNTDTSEKRDSASPDNYVSKLSSGVMRWDSYSIYSIQYLLRIYDWYTLLEPVILPPGLRGWKHVPVSGAGAAGACLNTPVVRVFEDNLSACWQFLLSGAGDQCQGTGDRGSCG